MSFKMLAVSIHCVLGNYLRQFLYTLTLAEKQVLSMFLISCFVPLVLSLNMGLSVEHGAIV